MGRHAEARGKAQNRPGILRDIGLKQRDLHGLTWASLGPRAAPPDSRKSLTPEAFVPRLCDAAIAGLRVAGKGANRTAPDCAA